MWLAPVKSAAGSLALTRIAMNKIMNKIPLSLLIVLCLTLGLAPFRPQPHLLEKLAMLVAGDLVQAIDIFDLLLHASPWLLLILKLALPKNRNAGD